ncbi:hypothetical protein HanPSC8_Chr01g0022211 [Helianthus annuus]|nr:hypothetical protein HanPSC8_Chr01g0022211 [Helianthus annuus]
MTIYVNRRSSKSLVMEMVIVNGEEVDSNRVPCGFCVFVFSLVIYLLFLLFK